MKPVAAKKKASGVSRVKAKPPTLGLTHVEDLKSQLSMVLSPDFSSGQDYWPRLDRRLAGRLPDLARQLLDVLEAQFPTKNAKSSKRAKNAIRTHV